MGVKRPQVRITIDQLVLKGFAPEQRDAIAAGLATELQRYFSDAERARAVGANRFVPSTRAPAIALTVASKPFQVGVLAGRQLARSLVK
jgi:hypothetical protein